MFVVMALTQVLGVGTMALIAQAVGRKDHADANLVFNQAMLSLIATVATLVGGYLLSGRYMRTSAPTSATIEAGIDLPQLVLPGLALQFAVIAMVSALRGTGIAKPTMVVQMLTVLLNALLAPILIAGWLTGHPMGVAGAGLATTIAVAVGVVLMLRSTSAGSRSTSDSGPGPGGRNCTSGAALSPSACRRAASSRSCSSTWR